jgi:hypothetical protein
MAEWTNILRHVMGKIERYRTQEIILIDNPTNNSDSRGEENGRGKL